MKDELLNYLKSSISRNWLDYYAEESESNGGQTKAESYSQDLYRSTEHKLAKIQSFGAQNKQKLTIFVSAENPIDFISAFLAGVIAETHIFLCNPNWQQREWEQVLNLVKPDLVFGNPAVKSLTARQNRRVAPPTIENKSLIMIPTGGTSGRIKFAIHTWSTLKASVVGFKQFFDCPRINSWCTLPFYHVSGLMQLMRSLVTQGNLVICPYQLSPTIKLDRSKYFVSLVPTQLQYLLDRHAEWLKRFQTVLVGGAPSRRSLLDRARKEKIAIALIYGSTETASGVVALKPEDFWAGNNSNGRVLPHARVSIDRIPSIDLDRNSDRLGSIAIDSTSLCLGYYPQLVTSPQPLITDDLGYFDSRKYLYLVGRNSHKIITGGENVFPQEVEAAVYATQLVEDVCVLGIPDRHWGQAVTAVYVPHHNQSNLSTAIEQRIQSQLAKYKQPKNWIEVKYIPRNERGKIDYQQLKAIAVQKILGK